MTLEEFRTTYAWKGALDLAPQLVRLAEQLPEAEANGLAGQLRTLASDVPAAVASDLVTNSQTAGPASLKAVATLEVIERVYPALDTATVRTAADELASRVTGPAFTEQIPAPAPAVPDELTEAAEAAVAAADSEPDEPTPLADQIAAPQATPPINPIPVIQPPVTTVPVAPVSTIPVNEVTSVQPDSPQQTS